MSFSMKDVTILTQRRSKYIKAIFGAISTDKRLTSAVVTALHIYVDYMLRTTGTNVINSSDFKSDLNKLLAYHCNKNHTLVTRDDVEEVETYIISDIKRAINAGGLQYVKYDKDGSVELKRIAEVLRAKDIEKNQSTRFNDGAKNKFGSAMTKEAMEKFLTDLEVI